jgi:glycosyltransferase involved in cell wall biosynthesis
MNVAKNITTAANDQSPSISFVVPVYRSAATLAELHRRIKTVFEPTARAYELIFIEDCGADGSWSVIETLVRNDPLVRGIRMSRNYGQHNALLCGIRAAQYEVIVTLDDDLQNPPEEIPKLLAKLNEGYDVVYGTPQAEQHGFLRDQASRVTKLALKSAMGIDTARHVSAFRAFRTPVRDAFSAYRSPYVCIDVLLTWGASRFTHLAVRHEPRQLGVSNYTVKKLATHALNMITGFSTLPLRLATFVGFGFTLFGFGILTYVLAVYLIQGDSVPGFPFLASVIAIFSGAQLFALGIIGEYLARMHLRSLDRPAYTACEDTAVTLSSPQPESRSSHPTAAAPQVLRHMRR